MMDRISIDIQTTVLHFAPSALWLMNLKLHLFFRTGGPLDSMSDSPREREESEAKSRAAVAAML